MPDLFPASPRHPLWRYCGRKTPYRLYGVPFGRDSLAVITWTFRSIVEYGPFWKIMEERNAA